MFDQNELQLLWITVTGLPYSYFYKDDSAYSKLLRKIDQELKNSHVPKNNSGNTIMPSIDDREGGVPPGDFGVK